MTRLKDMQQAALQYSIARAPVFAGLPTEDLRHIAAYAALKIVDRGAYLFRQQDPVIGFFIVRSGLINVHRINSKGREQIVHLLRPGDSFAERAITSHTGYPASARAVEASEVILIPIGEFKAHLKKRPDLAWRLVASMSQHLRSLVSTLEGLKFRDIETRLIFWLLQRCPDITSREPVDIVLGSSKGELASNLATRQETLSRTFRKLRLAGQIEVHPRSVMVLCPAKLHEIFSERAS